MVLKYNYRHATGWMAWGVISDGDLIQACPGASPAFHSGYRGSSQG